MIDLQGNRFPVKGRCIQTRNATNFGVRCVSCFRPLLFNYSILHPSPLPTKPTIPSNCLFSCLRYLVSSVNQLISSFLAEIRTLTTFPGISLSHTVLRPSRAYMLSLFEK